MDGTHTEGPALVRAAHWIEVLMLGPVATTIAVLAIASLGFAMLGGRLSVRRGLTALFGCFILFGAPAIARGILGSASELAGGQPSVFPERSHPSQVPEFTPPSRAAPSEVSDPYAGASIR